MADRKLPEINAGSMADIAFLLLIFFLVTTTIQTDSGLSVLLPPYIENDVTVKRNKRNVFAVQINSLNQMLVRDQPTTVDVLRERAKEFIMNPTRREDLSDSPKKAVISLLNDNGTSYEMYIAVYNELKAAYNELWNDAAQAKYGRDYKDLTKQEKKLIRKDIPLVISEAEPTSFEN
jgi:biopolymer transport protein ExbD